MEIFYIKSDRLLFSLSGEACGGEEIKMLCADEYVSHGESVHLYKNKPYKAVLFNPLKGNFIISVNGMQKDFTCLLSDERLAVETLVFDKAGENRIEIFSEAGMCADITFDVCEESGSYKTHFYDMKSSVSRMAKPEILAYLKSECERGGIEIDISGKTAFAMLEPTVKNTVSKINSANERKYYKGDLKKSIVLKKRAVKKFKSINIYDTAENRKIKSYAAKLTDFIEKLMRLCGDEKSGLAALNQSLKSGMEKSVVLRSKAEYDGINISGGFYEAEAGSVGQMYKFFCFVRINKILSERYIPLEDKVFGGGFDICKKRQTKYINTENNNVITLIYNSEPDTPAIIVKAYKKDFSSSYKRSYAIEPVYKENAGAEEKNTAYRFKGKYKPWVLAGVYAMCFNNPEDFKNVLSLSPYESEQTEQWIKDIFGDKDLNEYPPFEEAVCNVSRKEFNRRDVMVAVAKTKSQFKINLKERFYYIPARFVENSEDISYVALYQSKTLFGSEAGIKYFGEIQKVSLLPRHKISEISKNSDEPYYRFDVKGWQSLENPIKPKDFAEVCMFTNMFLLKNAKQLPELYSGSFTEYILSKAKDEVNFKMADAYFKCTKEDVTVFFQSGETVKFPRSKYKAVSPKIEEMLKGEYK